MTAHPCPQVAEGADSENEQAWIADSWVHFEQARGAVRNSPRPPVDCARILDRFTDFDRRLQALVRERDERRSARTPEHRPAPFAGESCGPSPEMVLDGTSDLPVARHRSGRRRRKRPKDDDRGGDSLAHRIRLAYRRSSLAGIVEKLF